MQLAVQEKERTEKIIPACSCFSNPRFERSGEEEKEEEEKKKRWGRKEDKKELRKQHLVGFRHRFSDSGASDAPGPEMHGSAHC